MVHIPIPGRFGLPIQHEQRLLYLTLRDVEEMEPDDDRKIIVPIYRPRHQRDAKSAK